MPPKQATLGYVKSGQQTIGKFFGNPNGASAAPQQSKLKFSSKAESKSKAEKTEHETEASTNGVANGLAKKEEQEDVKVENGSPVEHKEGETSGDAAVKKEPSPSSPSRKRSAPKAEESEGSDDQDDAPPSKRQRQKKTTSEAQPKKGVATKTKGGAKSVSKPTKDDEGIQGESIKDEQPRKKIKTEPKSTQEDADEDDEPIKPKKRSKKSPSPAKPAVNATKVKETMPDEGAASNSDSESIADEEAEASEEDEKPEVSAKAAEKVQSTLKASGKEAYPDWKAGEPVPYAALCTTFSKIEMTTKRLEIIAYCASFLRQVLRLTPQDLLPTVLLMIGKLAADYAGIELGIGESLIMKAVGETTGRSLKIIKEDQQKIGDLGLVAAKSRQNQPTMFKPKPLTVRGVHEGLMKIATTEGQGAQGRKVDGIKKLLSSADVNMAKGQTVDINKDKGGPSESKFIIRALEGKMRLGLADKNLQVALAHAMVAHEAAKDGKGK
ncbi:DNA ligase, partial [Hortaea werneckii]